MAGEKCVIYVRVSSDEQVSGTSLGTQEATCRDYAAGHGWTVAKVYRDAGESAKTADRPQFQAMVAYCSTKSHGISRILVYKLDRFARNSDDFGHYRRGLHMASGAGIVSATEHIADDPSGNLMRTMLSGFAQFDNEVRAQRTVTAMKSLQAAGYWTHQAPVGYVVARRDGKPILVAHPVNGPVLVDVFRRVGSGSLSVPCVVEELARRGVAGRSGRNITLARVHELLRDPIYAGRIVTKWTNSQPVRAAFPALVDEITFDRVQLVMAGRAVSSAPTKPPPIAFPLRGFIRCACCDTPMTAFFARGRSGHYGYYECHKRCHNSRGRKEDIERQFLDLLDCCRSDYAPLLQLFREVVADVWEQAHGAAEAERRRAADQMAKLQTRAGKLLDAMLDETITAETYRTRNDAMGLEMARLRVSASDQRDPVDPSQALQAADAAIRDPAGLWLRLGLAEKARFEVAMFRDGLSWSRDAGLQTVGSGCTFDVLRGVGLNNPAWHPQADRLQTIGAIVRAFEPLIDLVAA